MAVTAAVEQQLRQCDLGCGTVPRIREGYEGFGVDIVDHINLHPEHFRTADLSLEPIPFRDNYFDLVTSHDFIEHIPKRVYINRTRYSSSGILGQYSTTVGRNSIIELFNEIYRVLKPNGIFYCSVPKFPTWGAIADPTHVSYWIADSLNYLSGDYFGMHDHYGHTSRFEKLWVRDSSNGIHFEFELRAIKDVPKDTPYKLTY